MKTQAGVPGSFLIVRGGICFIVRIDSEIYLTGLYTTVNILTIRLKLVEMSAEYSNFLIVDKVLFN